MGSAVAEGRREPTGPADTLDPAATRRAWTGDLAAVAVYLVLGFIVFAPIWTAGGATHMPVGGDQWRNVWFDQWTVRAVSGGHNLLYSDYANYPGGVNVLLNAGAPLLSLVFSPITVLFGPIAAFNLSLTLALPLSAATAYLLIRRVVGWRLAAFAGGLLYGFGPEEIAHGFGHVNLSFAALVPLIVLCVYELTIRQQGRAWRWGLGLGLLVVAQFFVSSEVLLETVLMSAAAIIIAALVSPAEVHPRLAHVVRGIGVGTVTAAVLLVWPVLFMARGPAHVAGPVQLVAQTYRSNLLAPFVPDSLQLLSVPSWRATADRFASSPVENGSYLGLPLIVMLLAGIFWRRRDKAVLVAGLAGVVAFILSLGGALAIRSSPAFNGAGGAVGRIPLPEALLSKLPLLENLIPARFALQVTLFAAIVGALLMDGIHRRWVERGVGSAKSTAGVCAMALVALLPLLPAGLVSGVGPDATPAGFSAASQPVPEGSVAVVFPFPSGTYPDPILWQADSDIRFKMPGGSFFVPQGRGRRVAYSTLLGYTYDSTTAEVFTYLASGSAPDESPTTRATIATEWRAWHVRSVLAVPGTCAYPAQVLSFLTWLLGPPSAHIGSTYAWYGANPSR